MVTVGVALAVLAMVIDWAAVAGGAARVEAGAKPLVMVGLFVAVGGSDAAGTGTGVAVAIALVFAATGDVLLLPALDRFVPGLLAFVGAHLAYLVAFLDAGVSPTLLVVGAAVATTLAVGVGRSIVVGAARRDELLGRAVVAYILVLSAMWAVAIAVGAIAATVGATLFVASDAVLGWNRFVAPLPRGRLLTHIPYHVGQALIVAWVVGG